VKFKIYNPKKKKNIMPELYRSIPEKLKSKRHSSGKGPPSKRNRRWTIL